MRILMLAQFYPPIIGGEERHVRNLSVELAERGHHVSVATLQHEGAAEVEMDRGVRIHRVRASMQRVSSLFSEKGRQHSPPFPDPEVLWALRQIIKCERPDVIHAHNWMVHSFLPLKRWSKARLVVTLHDFSIHCATKRLMRLGSVCSGAAPGKCLSCASEHYGKAKGTVTTVANALSGMAERRAVDMFLPVSRAVAEGTQLARYGVPYRIIPNFVPDDVYEQRDDTHPLLALLPGEDYLLFVGDVTRDKGVETLFQAYSGMEKRIPLVVIGRPAEDISLRSPENVRILQSWPHAAVMSAWARCTLALVPSIWPDPCPTVAMEAMAMGKPVVAARMGGLSDIVVDGRTGVLTTPGDPRALREAIQSLLDSRDLRESMGDMARQRVVEFQAGTVVPRIERVYEELVQS